ncbi:hypothetical protein OCV58_08305 [Megasphaera butyrica]|nr:hypothetical protein [Megasphaera butyrica]MCU6714911.1 hypothetical protein [Megasphaera butyrica]
MARLENTAMASLLTSKLSFSFLVKLSALAAVTVIILSLKALSPVKISKSDSHAAVRFPSFDAANTNNLSLCTAFSTALTALNPSPFTASFCKL